MKAISLWEPWASAMASGLKRNETRGWPTNYRGELVIQSSKRRPSLEEVGDPETYYEAMRMPYGYALCVVELYACVSTEEFTIDGRTGKHSLSRAEEELGNYTPGRFAWVTANCRPLKGLVPLRGRQGLWTLTEEEERMVREQL